MNEQNPGDGPTELNPVPAAAYYDRSTGLMIFGVLTIGLGCMAALGTFFIVIGQLLAASIPNGPPPMPFSAILPGICVYVILAVALIWLGIGSIRARRWARALLLIFSWSWLAMGLFEMVAMAFIMPKVLANLPATVPAGHAAPPAAVMDGVMVVMFLVFGVIFVIMPAVWTYFYSSRHVKLTCEWRDPQPGWTDRCPLPVLALCLWAWFSVPMMLLMPIAGHCVAPFFGMFLTGVPAVLFYLVLAVLWVCASWLLYRLDGRGWWLMLIALLVGTASTLVTFSQCSMLEMYRLMDYPDAQIEQIKKSGLLEGNGLIWIMMFSMVVFLGYLLFIKKYFRRT